MEELYRQILSILYGMWLRRWYAIGVAWLVALVGWGYVATMPDKYESFARIYVDTKPLLTPLMRGMTVDTNIGEQILVMQRTLTSRPNLEKVVRMTDLDLTVESDLEKESLLSGLESNIAVTSQGGSLVRVAYENTDPQRAKRVVQALMTIFVETNLGRSRKGLAGARRFIDEQIREYENDLSAAEKRLSDFNQANMGFLPGKQNFFDQMATMRGEYSTKKAQLDGLMIRRQELSNQLAQVSQFLTVTTPLGPAGGNFGPGSGPGGSPGVSSVMASRLQLLLQNRAELLMQYTERHPDVVRVQREIDRLQALASASESDESTGSAGAGNTTISNPVFEQTKLDIIQIEADIQVLVPGVETARQSVESLERQAMTVPVVQAEMSKLNRDYEIIKRNYEELIVRREKARIEQNIETKSDKVIYNLIEPPQVPIKPTSPNRPVFLSIVLLLALGAGAGVAFVLSQIRTTYTSLQSLRDSFAMPVLGAVTALVSDTDRRRRQLDFSVFAVTVLGLLLAYGGVVTLEFLQEV